MKADDALRELAGVTASQWGMVTTAQASALGVTRLMLSRLAEAGHLERLAHGVYKDSGAPANEFDDLRAAWLGTEPKRLAEDRISDATSGVVVGSTSAASLHGVGDSWASRHEFVAPIRRQSQREGIRFRQRGLADRDVTVVQGLPVMRIERTLADLLEDLGDQSLVADALGTAMKKYSVDLDRLSELLSPLAERNGFKKNDGSALLDRLTEIAGLDLDSVARRITANPVLGARVAAEYLQNILSTEQGAGLRKMMAEIKLPKPAITAELAETVQSALRPQLAAISKMLPSVESLGLTRAAADALNIQALANLSQQWTKNITFPSALQVQPELAAPTDSEEHHDAIE
ncbi:type IV toxin-antitoxin system AbiEi family antitoxin domain-containing protein [Propionimicrobium sp. PCR01-08-3]|uniref:type IV toxin-antitoxin system AbiEi family antitoxin domain-containing protein n=1 Tax=Propionimicrobium sp. PCR01-08-3 TaxID=3052086 RepID=UPI00255D127D|nr:type IV toxin-antitoxin system AbiEi family antitoxin domain-containing protein [Propionimicrobium sp. PCR01-08-3]WIY84158.1 type IV toxin-antitoxin system AbiEi family antitoxin domain-containing protein [Propionimicrobium sp. PCR01-08-3]